MLQKKICVVVGGAKGRGLDLVEKYASEDYTIAFMDVDKEAGYRLKAKMEKNYGEKIFFFHGNAGSEEDLALFAGAIIGQYNRVDRVFYHEEIMIDNANFSELFENFITAGGKVSTI